MDNRIFKHDLPKAPRHKKTSNKRVGRGSEYRKKHQEIKISLVPKKEKNVEEELAPFDGPMVYDENGTRIHVIKNDGLSINLNGHDFALNGETEDTKTFIPDEDLLFSDELLAEEPPLLMKCNRESCDVTSVQNIPEEPPVLIKCNKECDVVSSVQNVPEEDLLFSDGLGLDDPFVVLDSDSKNSLKSDVQFVKSVKPNGIVPKRRTNMRFTKEEREENIRSGEKLSDESINLVQNILFDSFPAFQGFQDTVLAKKNGFRVIPSGVPYIQILHSHECDHWLCMAFTGERHVLYDSLRSCSSSTNKKFKNYREYLISVPLDIQQQVAEYCKSDDDIQIDVAKVHQQTNGTDCGVFAIAFATHLAHGMDPSGVVFDVPEMRGHLIQCLEKNRMTIFPTAHARRGKFCSVEHLTLNTHCICNGIYHPEIAMVCCGTCEKWFHINCVIKNKKQRSHILDARNDESWYCNGCENGSGECWNRHGK